MTGFLQGAIALILFIVILGGLVLVHELGHFITARLARVRVLEFGIGFPPRAKVLANRGETEYTLNWLPIGGFVKLEGEDGDEADDPRSFVRARLPVKLLILVAGVVMNLLLSLVIFTGLALSGEPAIGMTIAEVTTASPAAQAGLKVGDTILSVNGNEYSAFDLASGQPGPSEDLRANAGQTVALGIERADGSVETVTVALRVPSGPAEGALGVRGSARQAGTIHYGVGESVQLGAARTRDAFGLILGGLGDLGKSIVTSPTTAPPAAGPVGIAFQIGDVLWSLGPLYVIFLVGLLSANLALVNVLPFPPLDGGRMLVIVLKAIAGPRISLRAERLTYAIGFIALFTFLIWITVFDVARQFGGTP